MAFQLRAQLGEVLVVSGFDRAKNVHGRNIGAGEGAIVHDLFNARAGRGDLRCQIGEATGPIADDWR